MSGDLSVSQRSSSIHLFVSKQAVNHRAGTSCLPVPLTSPLESLAAAECSGQPRAQALTRPASKLRQSLPRVELPQAAPAVHHGLCVQIRKAASWSKHTHKEKRKTHGQKEKKGGVGGLGGVITGITCLRSDSVIWRERGNVSEFVLGFA